MFEEQIKGIKSKLERLRELDPYGTVLFGATEHKYAWNKPASAEQVQQFEYENSISLPEGYLEFLLYAGNGGAGPYYGLNELNSATGDSSLETTAHLVPFSSTPECGGELDKNQPVDELFWGNMHETALVIGPQGCSVITLLVVDGPCRGQVWAVDYEALNEGVWGFTREAARPTATRPSTLSSPTATESWGTGRQVHGINPFSGKSEAGLQFLDWYEHWVETGLKFFDTDM